MEILCFTMADFTAKLSAFWAQFVGWFQSGGAAAAFAAFTPIIASITSVLVMVKKCLGNFDDIKKKILDADKYGEIADAVKQVINENYELKACIKELTEMVTKIKQEVDDYGENTTNGNDQESQE